MGTLILSAATLAVIASHATAEFRSDAVARADGMFDVPFSEDTIEHINQRRFPGETDDAVVARLVQVVQSGGVQ